jgi:lysophospholipase L1-like esterase
MKMMFLGDSITEGFPGVSFFKILRDDLSGHELINCGKGGDTVISINRRAKTLQYDSDIDIIFLWIGVNDVFVKLSKLFPIYKKIYRQIWAKDEDEFRYYYNDTLQFLSSKAKILVVIPPVFVGEDIDNIWNRQLSEFDGIIKELTRSFENIKYLDVKAEFLSYLKGKPISKFVPKSSVKTISDALLLNTPDKVDARSLKRGLYLTLDGVHLNSNGAVIVSDRIRDFVYMTDIK